MKHRIKTKRSKRHRPFLNHLKSIFLFFLGGGFLFAGILVLWASFLKIPDFNTFNERKVVESTKIYDRTGKILLYDVHDNVKRTLVPFDQISPSLRNATIAVEDANFYHHYGVDPKSIIRAFIANVTGGKLKQGGSTSG